MSQIEINMENSKDKVVKGCIRIIDVLLASGSDEDAHLWGLNPEVSGKEILNYIENIENVDRLMSDLRPVIFKWLKITAEDYIDCAKKS